MSSLSALTGNGFATGLGATGMAQQRSASNFSQTGILGLDGTYAYPPGSEMSKFMDNINNTVAIATRSPDGSQDVVSWANSLAQRAAARASAAAATTASGTGTGTGTASPGDTLSQLYAMLMSFLGMGATGA